MAGDELAICRETAGPAQPREGPVSRRLCDHRGSVFDEAMRDVFDGMAGAVGWVKSSPEGEWIVVEAPECTMASRQGQGRGRPASVLAPQLWTPGVRRCFNCEAITEERTGEVRAGLDS